MIKKGVVFICLALILTAIAYADKIEVSTTKESFAPGENITVRVSLYDNSNNPVNQQVNLVFEDSKKNTLEKVVSSNSLVDVNLGNNALSGYWKIYASYTSSGGTIESTALFLIEANELASFQLDGDLLTVANIGNTNYMKDIQILIGETLGTKSINLGVGEKVSFRLIAPDGAYDVKVSDGKTSITRSGVQLAGNAIGIMDQRIEDSSSLASGIKTTSNGSTSRNPVFVYIFLIAVFAAGILLAIQRRYSKK